MQGYLSKLGVKKESTWGTAVAVTELLVFVSESLSKNIETIESEFIDGATWGKKQIYHGNRHGAGSIAGEAVIDELLSDGPIGWEHILLAAIGNGYYNSTLAANIYTPTATLPSLTIAVDKTHGSTRKILELSGAKVNSFEVTGSSGSDGGKVKFSAELTGKNLLRTGDSGVTVVTGDFDAIKTATNKPEHLLMSRATFKIGDQSNALADGDRIDISEFTISCNNNLSDPQFSTIDAAHTDGALSLEPVRNERQEVTLSITRPRLDDTTFLDWFESNTSLQAQFDFATTGGTYSHTIYLPYLKISEEPAAPIDGAALLQETINFTAVWNTVNINPYMSANATLVGQINWKAKSRRTAVPA